MSIRTTLLLAGLVFGQSTRPVLVPVGFWVFKTTGAIISVSPAARFPFWSDTGI